MSGVVAGARTRSGRNRKRAENSRSKPVFVRFDDTEFDAIRSAAAATGLTPTSYVALAAVSAARASCPPQASPLRELLVELMRARTQVARFGVNVNQAVAALNATGEAPVWLRNAVELAARATRQLEAQAAQVAGAVERRR